MTDNELNALVAEKVMGQHRVGDCPLGDSSCMGKYEPMVNGRPCLPDYANDIAAAFDAFTKASRVRLMQLYYSDADEEWRVLFPHEQFTVSGKSPSKVMSFAALEAVGVEVE